MTIKIELIDNSLLEFNSFYDINPNLYHKITTFKCYNCNLDNIDFIANFINLKKLNASYNKIKIIPFVGSLEELEIYNNELVELPYLPNLKKLYAFNNRLTLLPNFDKLEYIDVSHNYISKISLGENIEKIFVGYNKITNIIIININVLEIECCSNLLPDINFIYGLEKLTKLNYTNNPIIYEPPYIKRFLPNNNHKTNSLHQIDSNVEKNILKLLNKKPNMNFQRITCDVLNNTILHPAIKKILMTCLNAKSIIEPTLRITFLELFLILWTHIKKHEKYDILNTVLITNQCKCITCMFNDIINNYYTANVLNLDSVVLSKENSRVC